MIIEGVNVGQFESFEMQADSRTLGNSGVLTLPLYAIGAQGGTDGVAAARVRSVFVDSVNGSAFGLIKPCAQVEVWCWYDSWNDDKGRNESQEKVKVFQGFIEHVEDGYPTKLHLADNAFILRFGSLSTVFTGTYTVQSVVEDTLPTAQKAFDKERESYGFTRTIARLRYSNDESNVQAMTSPIQFQDFGDQSPYNIISRIMQENCLYGGVSDSFNIYVGSGVTENTRPLHELSTRYNVIERNIVPVDGRFVDYDVKVVGILENGRKYTATAGVNTSRTGMRKSAVESQYAQSWKGWSGLKTVKSLNKFADLMLANLRGQRNKGRITCLLYPKLTVMDWVTYTDTVFENLSSGLYVLGYRFKADINGYYQYLEVTDQVFSL